MAEEEKIVSDTEVENADLNSSESEGSDTKKKASSKKKDESSKKTKKEIEALKKSLEDSEEKYLRMLAEYDNFRKRSQKEKEATYADAYADAIKEILPIIDNLERAVGVTEAEKLKQGLEMTLKQFAETLKKLGVEEIPANPGDSFDPNIHNAVMHTEDESKGENEIVSVFTKGYTKGDRVIRHPMVMVAN